MSDEQRPDVTYEEGERLGLGRREIDGVNAARALGEIARETRELQSDPVRWKAAMVKHVEDDIERLGKSRLHPSVAHGFHEDRESFIVPNQKKGNVEVVLGDGYFSVEHPKDKKGKVVATFATIGDALDVAYKGFGAKEAPAPSLPLPSLAAVPSGPAEQQQLI